MDHQINVREKTDNDLIENILIKNFGENKDQRLVYLYRKKLPISVLFLVSCYNEDPNTVFVLLLFSQF